MTKQVTALQAALTLINDLTSAGAKGFAIPVSDATKVEGMTVSDLKAKLAAMVTPAETKPETSNAGAVLKGTEVRGQMVRYVENGKRRGSVAKKIVRRGDVRGALLENGEFAPLDQLVKGKGAYIQWNKKEAKQEEAKQEEAAPKKPGRKPKAEVAETAPAKKPGRKPKAEAATPAKEEASKLVAADVRGKNVVISYKWGGEVQTKTVAISKVVNRDGERFALSGDLSLEFDKIERQGKKLVYTGRVSKADFEAA